MKSENQRAPEARANNIETAFLVGVQWPGMPESESREHLRELEALVDTMGLIIKERIVVKLRKPGMRYLIGTGKAAEIAERAEEIDVDCIIFDDDVSPSQQRNWENMSDRCVIDRQEVILDIFASRASTREAVLQVGLARMEYSLPRLTRAWTHLSRQRGGRRGTRGEGETQLEADRRIVLRKIGRMKKELEKVRLQRGTLRKRRLSVPMPTAAIVGYTNSGKSTLLNALTGAGVFVENRLFATLDPTTRRLELHNGSDVLITDTVGFVRKLPHDLVDAFKSTLEETVMSEYLIHILDASSPEVDQHNQTTLSVLEEIGASNKPSLTVFNKIDLIEEPSKIEELKRNHPEALFISAKKGRGLDELITAIKGLVYDREEICRFTFPSNRHDLAALVHRTGRVLDENYQREGIELSAQVPLKVKGQLAEYLVQQA